jgi:hypothetical protein
MTQLKELYYRIFKRHDVVVAFVMGVDGRIQKRWVIPHGNEIRVGKYTFVINPQTRGTSSGKPTYFCHVQNSETLSLHDRQTKYTAADYTTIVDAHVARDIFSAGGNLREWGPYNVVIGVIAVVAIAAVGFLVLDSITSLSERVTELERLLKLIGGIE